MSEPARPKARDLNQLVRYTMWSVFRLRDPLGETDRSPIAAELADLFGELTGKDVVVRGTYDIGRAARRRRPHALVACAVGATTSRRPITGSAAPHSAAAWTPVWSQMALHRPAEFNKSHVPAFLADEEPRAYVCVYPFVRSYEWYLLPDEERRTMLAEHGMMARDYPDVRANTVASFALGDYEWMLAFEADELHRIVDLMRHLRASRGSPPRPRGGAVLHRSPQADRGDRRGVAIAAVAAIPLASWAFAVLAILRLPLTCRFATSARAGCRPPDIPDP